jgi:hypothetical protein
MTCHACELRKSWAIEAEAATPFGDRRGMEKW